MIGVLLGVFVPLGYIVIGAAVWERLSGLLVSEKCQHAGQHCLHSGSHDGCIAVRILSGLLWPLAAVVWVGVRIGRRKRIFGFRARKAERVAKRIVDMEKEVFGEEAKS